MATSYICYIETATNHQGNPVYYFRDKALDKRLAFLPSGSEYDEVLSGVFDCFVDSIRQASKTEAWAADIFNRKGRSSVRVMGSLLWIDDDTIYISLGKECGYQIERGNPRGKD